MDRLMNFEGTKRLDELEPEQRQAVLRLASDKMIAAMLDGLVEEVPDPYANDVLREASKRVLGEHVTLSKPDDVARWRAQAREEELLAVLAFLRGHIEQFEGRHPAFTLPVVGDLVGALELHAHRKPGCVEHPKPTVEHPPASVTSIRPDAVDMKTGLEHMLEGIDRGEVTGVVAAANLADGSIGSFYASTNKLHLFAAAHVLLTRLSRAIE